MGKKTAVDVEKPVGFESGLGSGTDEIADRSDRVFKKKNEGKRLGFVPEAVGGWLDHRQKWRWGEVGRRV